MAVYTSTATGLWSAGATWVGGVKPPSAGGHSIVISAGHVVTYDEAAGEYGDDSATAIQVYGTLQASRTMNTQLTVVGDYITRANGTTDWGRKTVPDALTAGTYTAKILLNKSASMGFMKYGLQTNDLGYFYACGKVRKRNALITSDIAVGGTTCTVDDITGWEVGDTLVIATTNGNKLAHDTVVIATITPGAGTTGTITFGATTYAHVTGAPIGNFSSNVEIRAFNPSFEAYWNFRNVNSDSANRRSVDDISIWNVGSDSGSQTRSFVYGYNQPSTPFSSFDSVSFYCANSSNIIHLQPQNFGTWAFTNLAMFNNSSGVMFYTAGGTVATLRDSVMYYNGGNFMVSAWSQGGQGVLAERVKYWANDGTAIAHTNGDGATYKDCIWHTINGMVFYQNAGSIFVENSSICSPDLIGSPTCQYVAGGGNGGGQFFRGSMTDCLFGTPTTSFYVKNTLAWSHAGYKDFIVNKNLDTTAQELYVPTTIFKRENTIKNRSLSSISAETFTAVSGNFETILIPVTSGIPFIVTGYLRKNAAYGASTRPNVSISGQGITPDSFTMTDSTDTWEQFTLTGTPTTTGSIKFIFNTQSASTSGMAYLSGILYPPFVNYVDHYGYNYTPTSNTRVIDPVITEATEATVAAYTGISISSGVITLTANHSIQEIYDYCQYYRVENQVEPFFTSSDGVNFTCTHDLTTSGANITGSGVILMTDNTLTMGASDVSTLSIYASNGNTGYLTVSGLSGHSVLLQDNAGSQLDYTASVTGSFSYFTPVTATGTWKFVTKKAGYEHQVITFTPATGGQFNYTANTPQKINSDGTVMYTGSSSALLAVSFTGVTQANIDIGDGLVPLVAVLDESEVALCTNDGLTWLAYGNDDLAIFNSSSGDYLFMTTLWRLRRANAGDVNATLQAFAVSTDGIIVDDTNGDIQFLTSDTPEAIAAAVLAAGVLTTGKFLALK